MRDRHKIEFYVSTNLPDGYGGTIPGEALFWSTYATVKPLKSSRDLEANQVVLKGGYEFLIRYRKDKTPSSNMTIHFKGRVFTIQGVVNIKQENREYSVIGMDSGKAVSNPIDIIYDFSTI